jgi:hypothetical protein
MDEIPKERKDQINQAIIDAMTASNLKEVVFVCRSVENSEFAIIGHVAIDEPSQGLTDLADGLAQNINNYAYKPFPIISSDN